uniref:Uncharacterized protein n=1 Tax=Arundo donax TaxID=35708 RepID=A0A0A9GU35_ARUDO
MIVTTASLLPVTHCSNLHIYQHSFTSFVKLLWDQILLIVIFSYFFWVK